MTRFVQSPDTFTVEEAPLFEPSGTGEHLFVNFLRRGMSTPFVASELQKILKIRETEIGFAGNKDRLATAVQTFSLPARLADKALQAFSSLGVEVLSACRNDQKLRMGCLLGNRFAVTVETDSGEDRAGLRAGLENLRSTGVPNFFGPQRISDEWSFERGKAFFLNKAGKGGSRRDRFMVSVFQSRIFNAWLSTRVERAFFQAPLEGDLMVVPESERLFILANGAADITESAVFTGPIVGSRMRLPKGAPFEIEKEAFESFGVPLEALSLARAPGARRPAKVPVGELTIAEAEGGKVELRFFLPKGSYATVLLKEAGVEVRIPEKEAEK